MPKTSCMTGSMSELFVGNHFAFGKGRAGRIDDLVRFGGQYGFRVHPVTPVMIVNGDVVSSSRIRQLIQAGNMERAAMLLGRIWDSRYRRARDATGAGDGLAYGQSAVPADRVVPPDGVYAARAGPRDSDL